MIYNDHRSLVRRRAGRAHSGCRSTDMNRTSAIIWTAVSVIFYPGQNTVARLLALHRKDWLQYYSTRGFPPAACLRFQTRGHWCF